MAFSKELEALIEAVLADGVITETEREVLYEEARREGVDPRKVEIMVEARLLKMQKTIDDSKQKVRKCPSCGEIIPAMTAVCPSCGHVVDVSNSNNKALDKFISEIESLLVDYQERYWDDSKRAKLENAIRRGRSLYGDNTKINNLITDIEASLEKLKAKQKKEARRESITDKLETLGLIALYILPVLLICGVTMFGCHRVKTKRIEAKAEVEETIAKAQHQCDSLISLVQALPVPNKQNYKQCENELLKIVWVNIPCKREVKIRRGEKIYLDHEINNDWNSSSIISSFLAVKRAYASQIYEIYKLVYPGKNKNGDLKAEDYAPVEIREPKNHIEK